MQAIQDSLSEIEARVILVEHAPQNSTDIHSPESMVVPPISEANSQLSIDPLERAFMHENSVPVRIGGSQGVILANEWFDGTDQLIFPRFFAGSSAHIFDSQ